MTVFCRDRINPFVANDCKAKFTQKDGHPYLKYTLPGGAVKEMLLTEDVLPTTIRREKIPFLLTSTETWYEVHGENFVNMTKDDTFKQLGIVSAEDLKNLLSGNDVRVAYNILANPGGGFPLARLLLIGMLILGVAIVGYFFIWPSISGALAGASAGVGGMIPAPAIPTGV